VVADLTSSGSRRICGTSRFKALAAEQAQRLLGHCLGRLEIATDYLLRKYDDVEADYFTSARASFDVP
jgi:hypothetical protein